MVISRNNPAFLGDNTTLKCASTRFVNTFCNFVFFSAFSSLRMFAASSLFMSGSCCSQFHKLSSTSVMFRASRCYDGEGTANVQLNCPRDFKIRVQTAFTGISRTNACSYIAWDCVIQVRKLVTVGLSSLDIKCLWSKQESFSKGWLAHYHSCWHFHSVFVANKGVENLQILELFWLHVKFSTCLLSDAW